MIEQGDLLLVSFPFSDQSRRKVRPVIVISNNEFNERSEDFIVVSVTSNISRDKYTLPLAISDMAEGKLFTICCIKVENILKLDKELMINKIGKVKKDKINKILDVLIKILS